MSTCDSHPFEEAADTCRSCSLGFCSDCLVYSHGAEKPPYCIPCALVASGVRRGNGRGGGRRNVVMRFAVALGIIAAAGAAAVPVASALGVG